MEITLEILAYLHDARLLSVHVNFSTEIRSLTFTATYHHDCGLASMVGRTIEVTAEDITLLQSRLHGGVTGLETIDSCELAVSAETAALLADELPGARDPKARLSLLTHTGSLWEILCESLSVRLL